MMTFWLNEGLDGERAETQPIFDKTIISNWAIKCFLCLPIIHAGGTLRWPLLITANPEQLEKISVALERMFLWKPSEQFGN